MCQNFREMKKIVLYQDQEIQQWREKAKENETASKELKEAKIQWGFNSHLLQVLVDLYMKAVPGVRK
jgi:hypothetical protein